jgi:NAD(P)-dependent dehydrogenase (short-subunit alcohol dehydrogenase family)
MAGRLEGKVALITGGTSGIGQATVELFVAEGARVMIAARNEQPTMRWFARLDPRRASCGRTCRSSQTSSGRSTPPSRRLAGSIVSSNASGPTPGTVDTVTPETFTYAMDLLLGSVVFGMRYAARVMKAQGRGSVINNGSVAAGHTHIGQYFYSIAKVGVVHATRMAGTELGPFGISVNSVSPRAIATPIFFGGSAASASLDPEHAMAKLAKLT